MPRVTLTKDQRAAVYEAHSGACYCCGEPVPPFSKWSVVDEHLVCADCNEDRGGRGLEEFRKLLLDSLLTARRILRRYGGRLVGRTQRAVGDPLEAVRFAGEALEQATTRAPEREGGWYDHGPVKEDR